MIAEVYPLLRLPRCKKAFDYLVPSDMTLARGSFVRIPYRDKTIWGVVKRLKNIPPRGLRLKTVCDIKSDVELREEELSFFEWMSQDTAQSPSSILYTALPSPSTNRGAIRPLRTFSGPPLTLPSCEAEHVVRIVNLLKKRGQAFVQTPDLRRATAIIAGYLQRIRAQKTLVLVPTVRDAILMRPRLSGFSPLLLTGNESNAERFTLWRQFRGLHHGMLLGTRTAVLAIDSTISSIFILRSGDINYRQRDRNPRYDARELVWNYRERFGANLFFLDVAPQTSTLHHFHESEQLCWGSNPSVQVISASSDRVASPSSFFSYTALQAMENTFEKHQGQVLCVYNQTKGWIECKECGSHGGRMDYCPSCGGTKLHMFPYGNQNMARELTRLFPHRKVVVIDQNHRDTLDADVLVVTTSYYESIFDPFSASGLGLVIHMTPEAPLSIQAPTAMNHLLRDVWQWAWVAFGARIPFLIETFNKELLEKVFEHPFTLTQKELEARKRHHLPPFYRSTRITVKDPEVRRVEMALTNLAEKIRQIPHAVLYPLAKDSKRGLFLDCAVPPEEVEELLSIFSSLPDMYIIDTHPFD